MCTSKNAHRVVRILVRAVQELWCTLTSCHLQTAKPTDMKFFKGVGVTKRTNKFSKKDPGTHLQVAKPTRLTDMKFFKSYRQNILQTVPNEYFSEYVGGVLKKYLDIYITH